MCTLCHLSLSLSLSRRNNSKFFDLWFDFVSDVVKDWKPEGPYMSHSSTPAFMIPYDDLTFVVIPITVPGG